jgi:two-component system sensor histidine kinase ChvG
VRLPGFLVRIPVRLTAFTLLVAFVPVVGVLSLGTYERQLLQALERSLVQQGRMLAAALEGVGGRLAPESQRIVQALRRRSEARLRVVDRSGSLIADSATLAAEEPLEETVRAAAVPASPESPLYRIASLPVRIWREVARPPRPPLTDPYYAGATVLAGEEIRDALAGRYGAATRLSGGQRSVTLYSAIPVFDRGAVAGAVLVSQSTYRILIDLHDLRLDVFLLFLASVAAAAALSLLAAATITVPLRRLARQAHCLLDPRGKLTGRIVGSARRDEVGELSRSLAALSAALERRMRLLESFGGDVAHELRNPLASIRSAAELAAGIEDPAERGGLLAGIQEEARRMERLLAGVREVSLLDAGALAEEPQVLDLAAVAGGVAQSLAPRAAERRTAIRLEGEGARVRMAPSRLERVVANLLDNALDFSPEAAEVSVRTGGEPGAAGPLAVLAVTDRGPGIPPQHLGRVFDRFFSWRPGEAAQSHSGLGLAIVRSIVEGAGGSVTAENAAGAGARFTVRLPAAP